MARRPLCYAPWTNLFINDASYNCCCFYGLEQDHRPFPAGREDVLRIFNGPGFREIRRRLLENDIKGTACETCLERQESDFGNRPYNTAAQTEAALRCRESAERGEIEVSHAPIIFSLNTCTDCNLRCVMCYNSKLPEKAIKGSLVPYRKFIATLNDVGLENIAGVTAVGGETFMTEDALEVMRFLAENSHTGIRFSTNTNGTLLHRHADLLERMENLFLEFSIDAVGQSYERIRRGASWERLLENFHWCADLARSRPGWELSVNAVIMKTSLPHMREVIELAAGRAGTIRFTPVMGDYFEENVFLFPELLEGMDWRRHFDEAEQAAKAHFPDAVRQLRSARRQLERAACGETGSSTIFIGAPARFAFHLRHIEAGCPQGRTALVGTRNCHADFLAWVRGVSDRDFVVAAFDLKDTGRRYAGHRVVDMDALSQEADCAVLCCQTFEYRAYREHLAEHHPDLPVQVLPFWGEEVYAAVDELARRLDGREAVFYGAGGTAEVLLDTTALKGVRVAAFADGNQRKWGDTMLGRPVVEPARIPEFARDVVICSEKYTHAIAQDLDELHGNALTVHRLF